MQELNDLSNFAQKTFEDTMGKKQSTSNEDTEDKKPSFMEMMNQLRHLGPLLKDAQFTRWVTWETTFLIIVQKIVVFVSN